jgi:hypothetical protein
MLCRSTSSSTIIAHHPHWCFVHQGCFVSPSIKSTASVATKAATVICWLVGMVDLGCLDWSNRSIEQSNWQLMALAYLIHHCHQCLSHLHFFQSP